MNGQSSIVSPKRMVPKRKKSWSQLVGGKAQAGTWVQWVGLGGDFWKLERAAGERESRHWVLLRLLLW